MSALLVLAIFFVFAALMYRRAMPALVALPLMALAMALVAGVPVRELGGIVTDGAASLAPVYVAVVFGALLGRVTLDTGIARAMVNLAAEYGGERPLVLALLLCALVALLFTSLWGLGAIIMIGSIVLPILMTTGVPRTIAATLFLMAFALGFIFNIANWTFYTKTFGVVPEQLVHYAVLLAIVDALALVVYACVSFGREREYATWAVRASVERADRPGAGVPAVALATPLVPLLLYYALHVEATVGFAIAALFGAVVTRPRDAVQTLVAAAIRGVEDVAPAILLFMGIGMLVVATRKPEFLTALSPLLRGGWPSNPLAYVAVFGLASPLVLYRGPLNPFGVGIAIFIAMLAVHALPPIVLVAAIMGVVQVQNVCDPTNTANVWVANFTGVGIETITRRTLPYQTGVAIVAAIAVAVASGPLFGSSPFVPLLPAARADVTTGFYASAPAAGRIGVGDDGTPLGRAAARATVAALGAGAFRLQSQPNAGDCASKPYAAYVNVLTARFSLLEGEDFNVGLRLEDCGGWIVDEWHDHTVFTAGPTPADARALAAEGVARLRGWSAAHPLRSANLFARGLYAAAGDPPTYFYAFFKTVDGQMRLYVRGGGPAYQAGLRTGDVLERLDGQYWWQYGTYQTQARAFDGRAHALEVERAGQRINVELNRPFVAKGGDDERSADRSGTRAILHRA